MKKHIVYFLLLILLLISGCKNNDADRNIEDHYNKYNILDEMVDGKDDEIISLLYTELNELKEISDVAPDVYEYYTDLNHDGKDDLIVYIRSIYHSGTGGDSLNVWFADSYGSYYKVLDRQIYLLSCLEDKWLGKLNLLEGENADSLLIEGDDYRMNLYFDDKEYVELK